MNHPIVFLSHATEDKVRFVIPFATALRARGIDVWLDKWEIVAGDSLVQKIFDEGLSRADAVLIVLSATSVTKKWVREELDASVVAKITKGTRLIPVVLDGIEVPAPLKHTVWVAVSDSTQFGTAVDQVVSALFGAQNKPPLGDLPRYAVDQTAIPGRSPQDSAVLKIFCDLALEDSDRFGIMTDDAVARGETVGLTREQVIESATVLSEVHDLEASRVLAPVPPHFTVTTHGFIRCVSATMPNYEDIYNSVASAIINGGHKTNQVVAAVTGHNLLLVEQILELMADRGLIDLAKCHEREWLIANVSPRLRRVLGA